MKPNITCVIEYFPSAHLSQIYDGFEQLRRSGVVDVKLKRYAGDSDKPLLTVIVNDTYKVIYDTLDGLNWIDGTVTENLHYFKNEIKADFYFKRSYNAQVREFAPENCRTYPLGLNYYFTPSGAYPLSFLEQCKDLLKNNFFFERYFGKTSFPHEAFEYYPLPNRETKILFLARLWDPHAVTLDHLREERENINRDRMRCITACRNEFGTQFTGGLAEDKYSRVHAKDLTVSRSLTKREKFLSAIRQHDICIATTGLHGSIGWKFGEFVAASRGIVTEPLQYDLPGNFLEDTHYLTFTNEDDLITKIQLLLRNKDKLRGMMINNYHYYRNNVSPETLVLNTLLTVLGYRGEVHHVAMGPHSVHC